MEPFIGQIQAFGFNFAPRGWAKCDGQLMSINANSALFSLLGTFYGGDGRTTFGLPDLRGRVPINDGRGPGLIDHEIGGKGGVETVALRPKEMPAHDHAVPELDINLTTMKIDGAVTVQVSDNPADKRKANGNVLGNIVTDSSSDTVNVYDSTPDFTGDKSLKGVKHSLTIAEAVSGTSAKTKAGQTANAGQGNGLDNMQPYLVVNYSITLTGIFPSRN